MMEREKNIRESGKWFTALIKILRSYRSREWLEFLGIHLQAARDRIFWYSKGTSYIILCFHRVDLRLQGFSDADWSSDRDEQKSI